MEKEKRQKEGKSERSLGLISQVVAALKYVFSPHNLTVEDAQLLQKFHEKTGIRFVVETDRKFNPLKTSNKKEKK
jgi:hypothetical protein